MDAPEPDLTESSAWMAAFLAQLREPHLAETLAHLRQAFGAPPRSDAPPADP